MPGLFASRFNRAWEDLFFQWLIGRRLVKPQTAADYLRHIRRVCRHAGVTFPELRAHHLEDFLSDPRFSWSTKNLGLISVRLGHRWGADRGFWKRDVDLLDTRLRRKRPKARRGLTMEQAHLALSHAHTEIQKKLVLLGLYQGLRLDEMVSIDTGCWVEDEFGGFKMLILDSKFDKDREVPVHKVLLPHRDLLLGTATTRKQLQKAAHQLREPVGREDLTPQIFRATFGQTHRNLGTERQVIGELLGHAQIDVTTTNYAPVTYLEMRRRQDVLAYHGQIKLW